MPEEEKKLPREAEREFYCPSCKRFFTESQARESGGLCPYCGQLIEKGKEVPSGEISEKEKPEEEKEGVPEEGEEGVPEEGEEGEEAPSKEEKPEERGKEIIKEKEKELAKKAAQKIAQLAQQALRKAVAAVSKALASAAAPYIGIGCLVIIGIVILFFSLGYVTSLINRFLRLPGAPPTATEYLGFPSNLTKAQYDDLAKCLSNYILKNRKMSPLGTPVLGKKFVESGEKGKVNPALLVAIAGAESEWATNGRLVGKLGAKVNCYNFYSLEFTKKRCSEVCPEHVLNQDWCKFKSFGDAIDNFGPFIYERYLSQGLDTIPKIGATYCPGCDNWIPNVTTYFKEITEECPQLKPSTIELGPVESLANPKSWHLFQSDPRWGGQIPKKCKEINFQSKRCNPPTFRCMGCGLTSIAMVLRFYGYKNVTPIDIGKYCCLIDDNCLKEALKELTNGKLIVQHISPTKEKISDQLKKKIPVILSGKYFTSTSAPGHFVVVIGIEGDNFVTNDPGYCCGKDNPDRRGESRKCSDKQCGPSSQDGSHNLYNISKSLSGIHTARIIKPK